MEKEAMEKEAIEKEATEREAREDETGEIDREYHVEHIYLRTSPCSMPTTTVSRNKNRVRFHGQRAKLWVDLPGEYFHRMRHLHDDIVEFRVKRRDRNARYINYMFRSHHCPSNDYTAATLTLDGDVWPPEEPDSE